MTANVCVGVHGGDPCGRPLRPGKRSVAEFPGTWPLGGNGRCRRCYGVLRRGHTVPKRVLIEPGQPCSECGDRMRPKNTTLENYPRTKPHAGRGMCSACYQVGKREAAKPAKSVLIVDPYAPRVPAGWFKTEPKPVGREQKSTGQHVYSHTPDNPPHVVEKARAAVMRNAATSTEAHELLAMLGLLEVTQ